MGGSGWLANKDPMQSTRPRGASDELRLEAMVKHWLNSLVRYG